LNTLLKDRKIARAWYGKEAKEFTKHKFMGLTPGLISEISLQFEKRIARH